MREIGAERRKHPPVAGGTVMSGKNHADVGSNEELLTLFESRVLGQEVVRGRKTWIIECAARQHEREVLSWRKKLWVDEMENVAVRRLDTVAGDATFAEPGSTIAVEFEKINDQVWQQVRVTLDFTNHGRRARTEYLLSKFQKFDVQSTITVEPVN